MSKDFKEGFKEGFTLGTKLGYKLSKKGCGSTDIEDLFQTGGVLMVVETDPQAAGLGYKADANKVDKTKFPKYADGQNCGICSLYQGKLGSASGGCSLTHFSGKLIAATGWCKFYAKKV